MGKSLQAVVEEKTSRLLEGVAYWGAFIELTHKDLQLNI